MQAEDAWRLLDSPHAADRLRGARILQRTDTEPFLSRIQVLQARETDAWVLSALGRAVRSRGTANPIQVPDAWINRPDSTSGDTSAIAVETVTQTIVHEIRPLLTDIKLAAKAALGDEFKGSDLHKRTERLKDFLSTLERLHSAAMSPSSTEIDLTATVGTVIENLGETTPQIRLSRLEPVITRGDSDLLALVLVNAIRNAVEASQISQKNVVVNWGATAREAWIVVLDEGTGLPTGEHKLWEAGVTKKSKEEHFGWGLAIAKRAADSMQATIRLSPREDTGTSFEIRWETLKGEHT